MALRGLTTPLAKFTEIWKMLRINNTLIVQKNNSQKLISPVLLIEGEVFTTQ